MSSLSLQVDATLGRLDPATAEKFERLVLDAVALVSPPPGAALDCAYFDSVIGAFADVAFERPSQGELPVAKVW